VEKLVQNKGVRVQAECRKKSAADDLVVGQVNVTVEQMLHVSIVWFVDLANTLFFLWKGALTQANDPQPKPWVSVNPSTRITYRSL